MSVTTLLIFNFIYFTKTRKHNYVENKTLFFLQMKKKIIHYISINYVFISWKKNKLLELLNCLNIIASMGYGNFSHTH